jgi:hypothetical protein
VDIHVTPYTSVIVVVDLEMSQLLKPAYVLRERSTPWRFGRHALPAINFFHTFSPP